MGAEVLHYRAATTQIFMYFIESCSRLYDLQRIAHFFQRTNV